MVGGRGKCGKLVEIDDSCFSRQKYNCRRLRVTAWVFVDVERELGTPVLHLSLITPPRQCSPSLRHVSYPAPQSSVTAVGTMFVSSMKDSHTMPLIAPSFFCPLMLTQIRLRPHGSMSRFTSGLTDKTKLNL